MTIFSKLTAAFKSLPFSGYGGSGYGGGAAYVPGISLTGSGFPGAGLPGTNYDYKTAAGVLWQNPSAAACFVALTKAFAQSRPVLERREGKVWQQVDEHALLDLLNVPNEFYSGERLFGVTLISTMANGAGYWRIERDRKGDPAELWFEPPTGVGPTGIAPAWDEEHFIREYFYFIDGKRHGEPLPRQDVVYFRHGLNPANSREPWAPLSLAAREIATLNSASTYTGALLRNSAVPSGMVTLEGSSLASGTPPTPEQAEEMKRRIKAGFKGDQVGEPFVSSLPWKWTPFNWSPEQLNISKLQTWPQGMVCALLGTPEIVALLPTGEQPTYQNLAASMEWWWNNTVIPLEDAFADEIETQLFPAFGLDRHEYRLTWDRSQVPALQEDEIAKHQMVREDYRAGVIDLYTATVQLGGEAVEDMRGVYHPSAAPLSEEKKNITSASFSTLIQSRNALKTRQFHESDWKRNHGKFDGFVGNKLKMHQEKAYDYLTDALSTSDDNKPYREGIKDAVAYMPEEATKRLHANIESTSFYATTEEMSRALDDPAFPTYPEGAYDYDTGELFLDARDESRQYRQELYAHELSHAIDGINLTISRGAEWKTVWSQEMKEGQLTHYASLNPSEGFAEFGATVYSSTAHASIKESFPLCYNFWKERGLI